jgi:hypothetical protein
LPDGSTLTPDNLQNYKNSEQGQSISIRKGAKMSKTMNFDDCHDPSYSLCLGIGPCKVSVFGVKIDVISIGIEFEYWEPNAIVETVCSEGKSYYEDQMNLSSRMLGSKRIMGEETKIDGVPAQKCIETIRTGGGMEGSGATPRYFNEAHVWGVGILPRFMSSANPMEATVSSICGYAGALGGLFDSFSGMQGDSNVDNFDDMSNEEIETYSEEQGGSNLSSIPPEVGNEEGWLKNSYDQFAAGDAAGGMAGLAGLEMSENWKTAASIGMGAISQMQESSKNEVRPDKLCSQKKAIEDAASKSSEILSVTNDPSFNFDMFIPGASIDEGVCPLGISSGHRLAYSDVEFSGVKKIPFTPPCEGDEKDCSGFSGMVRQSQYDTSTLVSQVEIGGLFPACDGYAPAGRSVLPVTKQLSTGNGEGTDELIGYTEQGGAINESGASMSGDTENIIPASAVKCTTTQVGKDDTSTTCISTGTHYVASFDHRKQLNDYMANSMKDSFGDGNTTAEDALAVINQRIADLGGTCDSAGKPVGTWGDAIVGAAMAVAAQKGMEAAQEFIKNSEAYQALKAEATAYVDGLKTQAVDYVKDMFSEEIDAVKDTAKEYLVEAFPIADTKQFLADSIAEYLPGLTEGAGLDGMVGSFGGIGGSEALSYFNTAMDIFKAATFDGALKQAVIGMASSKDPTGLWPGFMSEMSALSWRGKDIPKAMQIKGMIGTVGHLPCALGSIGTDIGLGTMGDGSLLAATEDWLGCVGTWGPLEPQNGFVYHRDAKIASALAGYRAYKLAVTLMTIKDHPTQDAGAPMKINMDFPHKTKCFEPGTADMRWESKHGFDIKKAIADAKTGAYDYLLSPFQDMANVGKSFDAKGDRTAESKKMETEEEGAVFTYWRKSKCCLYVVEYYGSWGPCWEVEREY